MQTEINATARLDRAQFAKERGPQAREMLLELFRHMNVNAEVSLREGGEDIALHARIADGAEAAGLAGDRPAMQEPIVYLLSKMVNRGLPEGGPRAFVKLSFGDTVPTEVAASVDDSDPEVLALGKMLAERAKKLGKTLTVGPMTARERRSLHLSVKEAGGATTRSEGQGLLRRVLVVPDSVQADVSAKAED